MTADDKARITHNDDIVIIGSDSFTVASLATWGTWSRVEAALKRFQTPATPHEWSVLEAVPGISTRGLSEVKQALARTGK